MRTFQVTSIGTIHQESGMAYIQLDPEYCAGLQALQDFSHLQVVWWFSELDAPEYRKILQCDKPYQHAPKTMGIFATRSPIRPNPIALSVAEVLSIDVAQGCVELAYIDANAGTPLLDIKPYTPSMDRVASPKVPTWCAHWPMNLEASGDFPWEDEFLF